MGKTVRDLLVETLENLERKSFKKLKNKLNDLEIKKGHNKIPKGKLEEADTEDVANLIINYYTDSYGTEVTLTVLEAIDEKQEAEKLRIALGTVKGFASQVPVQEDGGAASRAHTEDAAPVAPSRDEEHFVDRHRADLIRRATLVAPILDDLYHQLTTEGYNTVRSKSTPQEQMRELLRYVESWGNEGKDELLEALRRHNAPLIRSLEGR